MTANINRAGLDEEKRAFRYVRKLKGFYIHLGAFVVVMVLLATINLVNNPYDLWVLWVLFGWGIGLTTHWLSLTERLVVMEADWEKKQVEKRLGRKI